MEVRPTMPTKKMDSSRLQQHSLSEQSRFSKLFASLHVRKVLRHEGISKSLGLTLPLLPANTYMIGFCSCMRHIPSVSTFVSIITQQNNLTAHIELPLHRR